jgi:SAM-dependent methyltransferase
MLRPTYRTYQAIRSRRDSRDDRVVETDDSGLVLPPPSLRRLVTGWADSEDWLRSGEVDARLIRELVERHGRGFGEMEALLDFGCGCGRIARWWRDLEGPRVHGCDYNKELVRWCRQNLPFIDARLNEAKPPLPYDEGQFDLVYAISLLSHLPSEQQREWLDEVRRVLKPDGLLLFTVMGSRFEGQMDETERRKFLQGGLVVRHPEIGGSNGCSVFHPPEYVREDLLPSAGYELIEWVDEDRSGQTRSVSAVPLQDNYLVRAG